MKTHRFFDYVRGASLADRITSHSIPEPNCGCWIWLGAGSRYGELKVASGVSKAHRLSWVAFRGNIPDGMHVLHKCDVECCVNPDHLFLGTHADNMQDKERKGRGNHAKGPYLNRILPKGDDHPARKIPGWRAGTRNGRVKLTEDQVREIRELPREMPTAVGRRYGVTKTTITGIWSGRLWSHLQ